MKRFICMVLGALFLIPILLLGCTSPSQSGLNIVDTSTITSTTTVVVPVSAKTVTQEITPATVTITETVTSTLPIITIPTITTTSTSGQQIVITYSATIQNQIGSGDFADKPSPGNVFLVVNMTINNLGYDSFSVNPFYFSLASNNIKYSSSFYSYSLPNNLQSVDILNGGSLTGSLAFEVPSGTATYSMQYEGIFTTYNIQWIKM